MKQKKQLENIKSLDDKALYAELDLTRKKLHELRFSLVFRKLKNYQEIKNNRKKISQILTIMNERLFEKLITEDIK